MRTLRRFLLAVVSAWYAAVGVGAAAQAPDAQLVIHNARIVSGTGSVIEWGSVEVRDGIISSVYAGTPRAGGAVEIDAGGMTLMPGMIDTHVHLTGTSPDATSAEEMAAAIEAELPPFLLHYLEAGFTTVFSLADDTEAILRARRLQQAGEIPGPRILAVGPFFTSTGGHPTGMICNLLVTDPEARELCLENAGGVDDPEQGRRLVADLAEQGVDAIKVVFLQDDPLGGTGLEEDVLAAVADEARRHGLPVIGHVGATVAASQRAIELGVTHLAHPPVPAFREEVPPTAPLPPPMSTTVNNAAPVVDSAGVERGVFGQPFGPLMRLRLSRSLQTLREYWDRGAVVAFGTDIIIDDPPLMAAREVETLRAVFSPEEIITAMTRNAARFMGLDSELGTIENDKLADLVVVDGNPLEDLRSLQRVVLVVQGGRVVIDNR